MHRLQMYPDAILIFPQTNAHILEIVTLGINYPNCWMEKNGLVLTDKCNINFLYKYQNHLP
jgi:hypothetical protein